MQYPCELGRSRRKVQEVRRKKVPIECVPQRPEHCDNLFLLRTVLRCSLFALTCFFHLEKLRLRKNLQNWVFAIILYFFRKTQNPCITLHLLFFHYFQKCILYIFVFRSFTNCTLSFCIFRSLTCCQTTILRVHQCMLYFPFVGAFSRRMVAFSLYFGLVFFGILFIRLFNDYRGQQSVANT